MTDDTDRPYRTLAEALAMTDRHRALGISVSVEAIRETLDRVAQLEAALMQAEAGRLHLYREMCRLDNPPDTNECPQCGGVVKGSYSTWYECWEYDMEHDEDCPLEIAHSALQQRWTDETFEQAKTMLANLLNVDKLQNGSN